MCSSRWARDLQARQEIKKHSGAAKCIWGVHEDCPVGQDGLDHGGAGQQAKVSTSQKRSEDSGNSGYLRPCCRHSCQEPEMALPMQVICKPGARPLKECAVLFPVQPPGVPPAND